MNLNQLFKIYEDFHLDDIFEDPNEEQDEIISGSKLSTKSLAQDAYLNNWLKKNKFNSIKDCQDRILDIITNKELRSYVETFDEFEEFGAKFDFSSYPSFFSLFYDWQRLKSIKFPPTLKSLPENSFVECRSLEKIEIPRTCLSIGNNCFNSCENLKEVIIEGEDLQYIGYSAFNNCVNLKELHVPGNCFVADQRKIQDVNAGEEPDLKYSNVNIKIVRTSKSSFKDFFKDPYLNKFVNLNHFNNLYNFFYFYDSNLKDFSDKITDLSDFGLIWDSLVQNYESATQDRSKVCIPLTFNRSVSEFKDLLYSYEFHNFSNLRKFSFPCGRWFTMINPFYLDHSSLKTVEIPANIESISAGAFLGCLNLENVSFEKGSKLKTISESAFAKCPKLKSITLPNKQVQFSKTSFDPSIKISFES